MEQQKMAEDIGKKWTGWRHKCLESGANSRVSTLCCLQTTSQPYPRKQQCCTTTVHYRKKTTEMRKLRKVGLEPGTELRIRAAVAEG